MQRNTKMFKNCFTYIFITYKATLLLHRNDHYNNSTVVITNWLIVKKYSFLQWQLIFSLSRGIFLLSSITDKTFTGREYTNVWVPRQMFYKKPELLTLWEHMSSSPIFWWDSSCSSFWFSVCVWVFCLFLFLCLWIVHSWLRFRFSPTFIYSLYMLKPDDFKSFIQS